MHRGVMAISAEQQVLQQATGQHMLIARSQAYAAGMSAWQVAHRIRVGHWKEVRPNVFAVDGRNPSTWEAVVMAVVLAVPGAVASHQTALWLHGVTTLGRPETIEVSAPMGAHRRYEGVRVRQHRDLPAAHRTKRRGIPVTTAERMIVDLAPELELSARLEVLEDAISCRAADRRAFVRLADSCSSGRAGVRLLVDAAGADGAERFRSWLESEASCIWSAAGLPEPRWNTVLRDGRGRIGEIDAVFPGDIVTVELDGMKFHSSPAQRRKDNERDRRLLLSGRIPLRFGWKDVVSKPDAMLSEIREALALKGPGAKPAGERAGRG